MTVLLGIALRNSFSGLEQHLSRSNMKPFCHTPSEEMADDHFPKDCPTGRPG